MNAPAELRLAEEPSATAPPKLRPRRERIAAGLTATVAIAVVGIVLHRLQFSSPALVATDGYFHIKFSYLMSHGEGLIRKLPWLYFTIHRDYYRDHHFLQHVLQMPFTFGDLRLGAKYAAWFFATLAFASFYLAAAYRGRVAAAILTVALLAGGNHFLYRMMMPRVPSMSLALLLLVVWLLATRRDRWLAGAMFAFVWLYDGFVLGVAAIVAIVLADLLVEGRFNGRTLLWGLTGVAAGMLINPYFPQNLDSLAFNFGRTVSDAQLAVRDTGFEWRPLDAYYLLLRFRATWTALGAGLILAALGRRARRETVGTLLLVVLTTALTMKARRYADVWPGMVFLFLAFAWADFWDDRQTRSGGGSRRPRLVATVALAALLAFIPYNYRNSREMMEDDAVFDHFQGAAGYLHDHAEPKSIVFNTDWDDFPFLFFFNSDNYYVLGLDQLYMKGYDPNLYDTWRRIRDGEVRQPSRLIQRLFHAEYVVINLGDESQRPFFARAKGDSAMQLAYRDDHCAVFRIVPRGPVVHDGGASRVDRSG